MIECNLTTQLDKIHQNAQYEIKHIYKWKKTKTNLNKFLPYGFSLSHFLRTTEQQSNALERVSLSLRCHLIVLFTVLGPACMWGCNNIGFQSLIRMSPGIWT